MTRGRVPAAADVGNCFCQGGDEARAALGLTEEELTAFSQPPSFLGTHSFYCDGGAGEDDSYDYSNSWKHHTLFNTTDVCVGFNGSKSESWWYEDGRQGPGWFVKELSSVTSEALEVRLTAGVDTYYENVGILAVQFEACVCTDEYGEGDGDKTANECFQRCQGTWVEEDTLAELKLKVGVITSSVLCAIVLAFSLGALYYRERRRRGLLHLRSTGRPATLRLPPGLRWHLFLSHTHRRRDSNPSPSTGLDRPACGSPSRQVG